jgi:hypothetical protein
MISCTEDTCNYQPDLDWKNFIGNPTGGFF